MKGRSKLIKRILKGLLLICFTGAIVFVTAGLLPEKNPQTPSGYLQEQSTYVSMEDGTKIAVRISLPADLQESEKVPAIMETTRYGTEYKRSFLINALLNLRIGKEIKPAINKALSDANYAFVRVDARGSGASFGSREMEWSKQEIEDMGTVIEWVVNQPWSNGKVGSYGMSYSGNTAEYAAVTNHPALLAAAALYPDFDTMSQAVVPGGILNEKLIKGWHEATALMDSNQQKSLINDGIAPVNSDKNEKLLQMAIKEHKTVDIYECFKKLVYADDILSGAYTPRTISPYHYKAEIQKSEVPLFIRAGWMDSGTVNGAIERYLTFNNSQTLVIGPWSHGGWHFYDPLISKSVSKRELDEIQAQEVIAFFDSRLRGNKSSANTGKVIRYYTMGEGKWKSTNVWPVEGFETTVFYFGSNGSLSRTKPEEPIGSDVYKVDFTATTGEKNRWHTNHGGGEILYADRAEEDKKLLTYTTDPLESAVEITGVPTVTLNVSSTANDGAFYVYLEDVSPDGKVTYITEGQLRALHRKITDEDLGRIVVGPKHSFLKKDGELLTPGETSELKIGMYATSVLIQKGHRIRISVAGHDEANFARIPVNEDPVIELQRNSVISSYVELPLKIIQE